MTDSPELTINLSWRHLKPGSSLAIEHGCACDPGKNFWGHGVQTVINRKFERVFFSAPGCPLHGAGPTPEGHLKAAAPQGAD